MDKLHEKSLAERVKVYVESRGLSLGGATIVNVETVLWALDGMDRLRSPEEVRYKGGE